MTLKDLLTLVRHFPRRGHLAADQVPAQQGARPRPCPGRACHRGRQYRRGHPADPCLARRQRRARGLDVARLAGEDRRADGHADRRSASPRLAETAPTRLSEEQAKAILDLRLQRLTALGRDEIKDELDKLAAEIADYLDILRSRARIQTIVKDELAAVKDEVRHPAPNRDRRAGRRDGGRGPDPARGHGRHRFASSATSSACRCRPIGRNAAAARAARACRPATRISSPPVRGLHPYAGTVLLVARPGLQGEGLAAAAGARRRRAARR